jgi:hypothetical protein
MIDAPPPPLKQPTGGDRLKGVGTVKDRPTDPSHGAPSPLLDGDDVLAMLTWATILFAGACVALFVALGLGFIAGLVVVGFEAARGLS